MPVPILFTIPNFITAGSGRAMLNIIERLDRDRFAPAVCVATKGGDLDREVEKLAIPFIEAPFTLPAKPYHSLLGRARKAGEPFRDGGFKIWHSFHYSDDYTEPIIARMAGARAWVYTKKNMNWGRRSWYLRTLLASRIAVQNSDMMRDFFRAERFARKARMVQRGVDSQAFRPDVPPRLDVRARNGIAQDAVVAACVAQLIPVKGHPTLLEAVAKVPYVHLLLAGKPMDKEYTASLEEMTCDLGVADRVHFLGGVQDVPALLAEVDLFVLPTWAKWRMEGCPVALLEAMSCGKACVATDIPGSRDLVEHEKSGLIVPPEDAEALAEAIGALTGAPDARARLGDAARQRVLGRFTIEHEVALHEFLYDELIGGRAAHSDR